MLEVPEVLIRAMPVEKRRGFKPISYPDTTTPLSDTEHLLNSLIELSFASSDLCTLFIEENELNGKDLQAPETLQALRSATASVISRLTTKSVKADEFISLAKMITNFIKRFDWPLQSLPVEVNSAIAQERKRFFFYI